MRTVDEAVASLVPNFDFFLPEFLSDQDLHDEFPGPCIQTFDPPVEAQPEVWADPATRLAHGNKDHTVANCPAESPASEGRSPSPSVRGPKRAMWSEEEHMTFLSGIATCCPEETQLRCVGLGPGVAKTISDMIGTRSAAQVRSHAQKHFARLRREQVSSTANC
mmetsp:Transcript_14554/g.29095  ORF Transcript_14554/g.29095 Transcript_14554/m.29095 type:complete len:164 (-) Transcript_14554:65-556(-)|eukprot:CAMPEP_0181305700 /NCGR_PEP_ID=MMETSP1101-20121128/9882_1 /TAXON_ID=46948 /ORGANISM="Rhodomonas abbreviata, Strain Caron Lab Isolate" /LENGTH=163 /DNA_ID=CAMNT_0023411659 /DNA_START=209 /DNA_END=700 /DNA_ORIENTATION=+